MGMDHGIRLKNTQKGADIYNEFIIEWRKRWPLHEFFVARARSKGINLWSNNIRQPENKDTLVWDMDIDEEDLICLLVQYHQFEQSFGWPCNNWYEDAKFLKEEISKVVHCIKLIQFRNKLEYACQ